MKIELVRDTREKLPLDFSREGFSFTVIDEGLSFGDYCLRIDGNLIFCIESKNPGDLISTIQSGHDRFKAEILRAKTANIPLLVAIEDSYSNVIFGGLTDSPLKIQKIIHTIMIKYNTPFYFFKNRQEMTNFIIAHCEAYIRNLNYIIKNM